jgi:hypothetical protein
MGFVETEEIDSERSKDVISYYFYRLAPWNPITLFPPPDLATFRSLLPFHLELLFQVCFQEKIL